jgi:hypothetical protein
VADESLLQRQRDDVSKLVYENGQLEEILSEAREVNARGGVDAKRRLLDIENDNQILRYRIAALQTRLEVVTDERNELIVSSSYGLM